MPVVQDEISLVKVANGDDGRGILGTPVATYAQSTSGTTPPTSWSASRPNVPAGQYLWTRVVTTYTDNTTSETQTPTLMGAEGESGLGIKDKSIRYAVGTSGNTPPTSGWQEMIPTVSANQYLWTKTTLVYTDESKTEAYSVGKMGANGADAKLLYLTASAENMAFNADDTPKTTQTINISAKLQNVTGTATFTAIPYIGSTAQTAITLGGTGNTRTLTSAQWTNKNWTLIAITATLDNLSDTLSIVKVKDGATGDKGDQGNQGIPGTPGADGKTPYTHWAYAWSADGKDRFTSSYPIENILIGTTSDTQTFTTNSGWPDKTGATNALMAVGADRLVKPGDTITYSAYITAPADVRAYIYVRLNRPGASNGSYEDKTSNRLDPGTSGWCSVTVTIPSDTTSLRFTVGRYENSNAVTRTLSWASEKAEKSDKQTIYTPSPADDFANAYPTYAGTYTDYEPTDSEDPSKYTWQRILGDSGQDGKDGEDGANGQDAKEVISGYLSNESIIVPATAAGSVTDFSKAVGDFIVYEGQTKLSSGVTYSKVSETGMTSTINSAGRYTVTALSADVGTATYQAVYKSVTVQKIMIVVKNKQGATGPAGSNGTDGKGIVSSATTYQAGTSGTTPPAGTWSTSIPSVSENQYLWTKIVLTYSDNTNSTAYSVAKMGAKGEKGDPGAKGNDGVAGKDGVGLKETVIRYAGSSNGEVAPTSGWQSTVPIVLPGNFLWTRTTWTYTDNTTEAGYAVSRIGKDGNTGKDGIAGKDGVGIASTLVQYTGSTSGTTRPTSGWSITIPTVAEGNFLWTRTTWTYTDGTKEDGYSVGKMGAKGETGSTGSTGATGATGNGIKSTTINFASSTSGTTAPSNGWSTSIPTVAAGSFLWTRTVLTFTDNTTNTSYTVAKQGEKGDPTGIISQATVPTNPYVGMLWQNTGASGYIIGATYQWNGSKFNLYIFTADNIVATTLSAITANLGNVTAGNISGVTINGSKFVNEFSYQPYPNNASLWCFGTTTIENGRWNTEYRQEGNKGIGIVDHTGTAILDPTGVQFSQTMVASNGENSFAKFNALELTMNYGGRGGTLTYNDLYSLPKTEIPAASGWSPYSTSSSNTNYPAARRTGRTVQLTGAFKNNSLLSNANTSYVIGILPVGFRPSAACKYPQKSNGDVIFMVTVNINGEIAIDYRLGWSGSAYGFVSSAAGSIFNIAGTFAAADI